MIDFSSLPEDVAATIPQDVSEHASLSGYENLGDLVKAHVELSSKKTDAGDWVASLEPDHKALVGVKGWKTPGDTIKSYNELEKYMGTDKIAMPRKDKDGKYEEGELERVMQSLGVPKTADEYKLPEGSKLVEGGKLDEGLLKQFNEAAHKAGILPNQYAFMMTQLDDMFARGEKAQLEQTEKEYNDSTMKLKTKWGQGHAGKVKLASNVLNTFADKEIADKIVAKYGNDPAILEVLANIGENLSEDALSKVGVSSSTLSPEAAKLEIKKLNADMGHPLHNKSHPDHNYWVKRRDELYKIAG